jgi:hypothetical protein
MRFSISSFEKEVREQENKVSTMRSALDKARSLFPSPNTILVGYNHYLDRVIGVTVVFHEVLLDHKNEVIFTGHCNCLLGRDWEYFSAFMLDLSHFSPDKIIIKPAIYAIPSNEEVTMMLADPLEHLRILGETILKQRSLI